MKRRRKNRGMITVFVALMLVPVVVCTGTMVDVARLKLYSSQAAMAADSYGEVVLSNYDNLLKELYGLFAVTQNQEGLDAIEDLAEQMGYSFVPDGDGMELDGFMPYKDAEVDISYEAVAGASLANNNVLMTQISDFMKFRVVEEVVEGTKILDALEKFDTMSSDMSAVNKRSEITKSSSKVLGKIDEYFEELRILDQYPEFLEERVNGHALYAGAMKEILESEGYADYTYYLDNKEEIDAAKERVEEAEEAAEDAEEGEDVPEPDPEDVELAEKWVDVGAYTGEIGNTMNAARASAFYTEQEIGFGDVRGHVRELDSITDKLEKTLKTLKEQIEELQAELPSCSEDLRKGIKEEIAELQEIMSIADEFRATVNLFYSHDNSGQDERNEDTWDGKLEALDTVKGKLLSGEQRELDWELTIAFEWYDFRQSKDAFYRQLEKLCKDDGNGEGNKKAADRQIDNAEEVEQDAKEELEQDDATDARDITSGLASQLGSPGGGEVPDLTDCLSGGASLSGLGNSILGKFLMTTYNFGMFSSRVTGIAPPVDSDDPGAAEPEGEYSDKSLTKVKMSRDVNYLYKAELEYLVGGHHKSKDNLAHTRNIICGIRLTSNFISSYSIDEINKPINKIAGAAAKAVTATGVGAAAAPLVRVAVSGALRLAFATVETASDWKLLKEREDVIFYKNDFDQLTAAAGAFNSLLGDDAPQNSGESDTDDGFALSYEDYLYVLMCLFTDEDTLLDRTSDLITLNVNQSQNDSDTLSSLAFKMSETVTAVKSTCEVDLDFVIVPEHFINLFLKDESERAVIQNLDDGSYGYSVIRGY